MTVMAIAHKNAAYGVSKFGGVKSEYFSEALKLAHKGVDLQKMESEQKTALKNEIKKLEIVLEKYEKSLSETKKDEFIVVSEDLEIGYKLVNGVSKPCLLCDAIVMNYKEARQSEKEIQKTRLHPVTVAEKGKALVKSMKGFKDTIQHMKTYL